MLFQNFATPQSKLGDVFRLEQKTDERVTEFIIRVKKDSKVFSLTTKEQTEIVYAGLETVWVEMDALGVAAGWAVENNTKINIFNDSKFSIDALMNHGTK
ncbi:hypothetical protein AVEN_103460-1 [Araneus ventricosus]|uniref:RNase H type-1 domain-containing protein n=1 Tax=Araneus ventricosus TaxID=182803 RepID=A0A4Y2MMU0_ARAVE|nr:hypothetical protein AVEN_103460-1 [Araneus ventricosus]